MSSPLADAMARARARVGMGDVQAAPSAQPFDPDALERAAARDAGIPGPSARDMRDALLNAVTTQGSPAEWLAQRVAPDFKSTNQAGIYADTPDLASLAMMLQPVYHGTPHAWEGAGAPLEAAKGKTFDLSKMGTGEGAQAYGWGAYATKEPRVAEQYRENLTGAQLAKPADVVTSEMAKRLRAAADAMEAEVAQRETPIGKAAVLNTQAQTARRQAAHLDDMMRYGEFVRPHDPEQMARMYAPGRVDVSDLISRPPGRLYKLDAPEDADLLHWDKPLRDQPQSVKKVAAEALGAPTVRVIGRNEKLGVTLADINLGGGSIGTFPESEAKRLVASGEWIDHVPFNGRGLYETLSQRLGRAAQDSGPLDGRKADALASDWLRAAGIPGHLYRGDSSGVENMVIYDPARAPVMEAYPSLSAMADAMSRAKAQP